MVNAQKPITEQSNFTWAEKGRIYELKHYTSGKKNVLIRSYDDYAPMRLSDMCEILNMSKRQCTALINKMKRHGAISQITVDGMAYCAGMTYYALCSTHELDLDGRYMW